MHPAARIEMRRSPIAMSGLMVPRPWETARRNSSSSSSSGEMSAGSGGTSSEADQSDQNASLDVCFQCNLCMNRIEDGEPVYMCLDTSYCSANCRRQGRIRLAQAELRRQRSSGSSGLDSNSSFAFTLSDTTGRSRSSTESRRYRSESTAKGKQTLLGWIVYEGLRKLSTVLSSAEDVVWDELSDWSPEAKPRYLFRASRKQPWQEQAVDDRPFDDSPHDSPMAHRSPSTRSLLVLDFNHILEDVAI
jgi:hypothetical protein